MVGGSSVITPEDVLQTLMNDGTIDAIRLKIINQLKANEVLKKDTITLVEHSKVLNSPGAEKQTKRELYDALRQELEAEALEKASKSIWELILDKDGLGKEINETVEKVFCQLSGRDPPLFPPNETQKDKVNGEHNLEKENEENKLEKEKVKEKNKSAKGKMDGKKKLEKGEVNEKKKLKKLKENENCNSSPKKRNFNEISNELEEGEVAGGSGVSSSRSRDSALARRTVSSDCGNSTEVDRRCKRTDGKTWRCTKEAVLDGKYCEKHMYRSSRSKKQVEATTSKKRVEISIPAKKKVKTITPKRELEITTRSKKELEITTRSKKELEITTRSKKELEITTRSKKQVEMTTQAPISNIASYSNIPISTPSQANTSEEDGDENNSDKNFSAAPRMGSSPKAVIVSAEDSSPKASLVSAEDSSPKATLASIERSFPKAAVVSAEDSSPTAALVTAEGSFPKSAVVSMEASPHTAAHASAEGSSLKAAVVSAENSSPEGAFVSAEGSSPKGVFASAEGLDKASFGSADCQKVSH